eukprot:TRINITY_DN1528_c0_g1_i1.p1 TRINITY_DN1528_c0_g1~~TRINITY_DN1528_c0_g1_i1.p1  ORF type:complete len:538 (-),score=211.04 TRINITY_DN1528_c0_g1_i1:504-2096(-)
MSQSGGQQAGNAVQFSEHTKEGDVRSSNLLAAKAVAEAIRTSLGPRGMDKMISDERGEVLISNDGATLLRKMKVVHPAAKMMVELSRAQDVEAGDGTTSVVVIAGALLNAAEKLFGKGIHASVIADAFQQALVQAKAALVELALPIQLSDKETLVKLASTSLNSKVVCDYASVLGPLAVEAVTRVVDEESTNVDFRNIRVVKKVGGLIEDTQLVEGLVFPQGSAHAANGPSFIENAKIGLIQFCLSPPKSNMDNQVVISDYQQMDRASREESRYLLDLVRKIKSTGCNVLLVQKSILRDAVTDTSLHFLAKMKIMVVKDIERSDIEFVARTLGCQPCASIEAFSKEKLGAAKAVEEVKTHGGKVVKVTGVAADTKTVSIFCRGSNQLVLDEVDRSVHDALCVLRSLVKRRFMLMGGGAPEIELALRLAEFGKKKGGRESYCIRAYAEALEVIPYTLAENAGLDPISIVTELRNRHANGDRSAGINVRKGTITDITEENVFQPLLVTESALTLATETVCMILKIDDILAAR